MDVTNWSRARMKKRKPRKVPVRVMKPRVGREENAIRAIYVIYKLLSRQGSRWKSWSFIVKWKGGKWRERERVSEPSAINGTCRGAQSTYLSMYISDTMVYSRDFRFYVILFQLHTHCYMVTDDRWPIELIIRSIIRTRARNNAIVLTFFDTTILSRLYVILSLNVHNNIEL